MDTLDKLLDFFKILSSAPFAVLFVIFLVKYIKRGNQITELEKLIKERAPELYRELHPYGWEAIQASKDRPMMTDVLPHLLLYFGGISTPLYRSEYDIVNPKYNQKRPRILKGETDYNKLKK